jgi:hypothetical protein
MEPAIVLDGTLTLDGSWSLGNASNTDFIGLRTRQELLPYRSIPMAAVTLSDGPALGDENAILGRGQDVYTFSPMPSLSAYASLDAYQSIFMPERVERITLNTYGASAASSFVGSAYPAMLTLTNGYVLPEIYDDNANNWVGNWDSRTWEGWRNVGLNITSTLGTTTLGLDGSIALDGSYTLIGLKGD